MSEAKTIPKHVGIILDGNRRWAKSKGLPVTEGHRHGADNLQRIAKAAFEAGVECVSAYVFSTENWQRTSEEVSFIMGLVTRVAGKYIDELHDAGIKAVLVGSRQGLDKRVLKAIEGSEAKTAHNTKGTLALCFNYGGQQEIVDATKKLILDGVKPEELTTDRFARALYRPELPPVDLLIRTSGEQRTSGFMLWQAAYAELYFTDVYWPDFDELGLKAALDEYANRQRRFGQ